MLYLKCNFVGIFNLLTVNTLYLQEKEAKMAFLQKAIDCVGEIFVAQLGDFIYSC